MIGRIQLSYSLLTSFWSSSNQNCMFKNNQLQLMILLCSLINISSEQYKIGVSFVNMKKSRSPHKDKSNSALPLFVQNNIMKELQKPYRPIVHLFTKSQQQQQKRNTNSIKKVLKELTDLKKELKDIKNINKTTNATSQGLDMSVCRKTKEHLRKSPSTEKRVANSQSSSKNKSKSNKKEISTQTKNKGNEVNEFSFSIDSKTGNKNLKYNNSSEQQDSESHSLPKRKMSEMETKRGRDRNRNSDKKRIDVIISDKVAAIQQSQLYERYLFNLKNNLEMIQISSNLYSVEDKMRLNVQLERIGKNICRIPIHLTKPEQYYESMQLYVKSLNNQLNNFILILNRSRERKNQLRQRSYNEQNKQIVSDRCRNCEQNEKKGLQKSYKRQLKRLQKQMRRLQGQMEIKSQQNNKLKLQSNELGRIIENNITQIKRYIKNEQQEKERQMIMKQEIIELKQTIKDLQNLKQREANKVKLVEEDLRYYRLQMDKIRNKTYDVFPQKRQEKSNSFTYIQLRNKELQNMIKQLKQKQKLYQAIISEKDATLTKLNSKNMQIEASSKRKIKEQSSQDSIDSAEYYKQRVELQQKQKQCELQMNDIRKQREQKQRLVNENKQVSNNLQLCLAQINKLHSEIDALEEANEKYKDKCLKSRIVNERKNKKEAETHAKKGQAIQEINDLIKHHRQVTGKQKK